MPLGVLFAIDGATAEQLRAAAGDDEAVMTLIEDIEEAWEVVGQTDKAWDAIHRALTDGALEWANGDYPLNHAILGGLLLTSGEDYIAVLKSPDQARDVALALAVIDDAAMAERYAKIVPSDYSPEYGDDDREYTVDWFGNVRDVFRTAADSGRWVLFTVDQ